MTRQVLESRRRGTFAIALLACFAAALACADLPPLAPDTCGNGVREAAEDCDSYVNPALGAGVVCAPASDLARACHFVCDGDARCPSGWGCGADGACRKPTGRFEPPKAIPLAADSLAVVDVDGDGRRDLIGADSAGLEVRFGDADGRFSDTLRRPATLSGRGPPAAAQLDEVARATLALALPSGIVFLRDAGGRALGSTTSPTFPLIENEGAWSVPLRARPEDDRDVLLFMYEPPGSDHIEIGVTRLPFEGTVVFALEIPGSLGDLAAVPVADLDEDGAEEALLAMSGTRSLYRIGVEPTGLPWIESRTVGAAADEIDALPPLVADADLDGTLDVLVPVSGRVWVERLADLSTFDTRFDALARVDGRFPLGAVTVEAPSGPAEEFVLRSGVYRAGPDSLTQRYPFPSPIAEAALADFDRDGTVDLVTTTAGEDALRVYFSGDGLTPLVVPVGSAPRALRPGDFDGRDGIDLAFIAPVAAGGDGLSVIFDFSEALPRPAFVGAFSAMDRLEAGSVQLVDALPLDGATDLFVTHARSMGESREGTVVLGSASRVLDVPVTLQRNNVIDEAYSVLFGRLRADRGQEAFAISRSAGSSQWLWWRVSPGATAEPSCPAFPCPGAAQLGGVVPSSVAPPCAQWLNGDVDGDGLDEVLGVSREGCSSASELVVIDLSPEVAAPGSDFLKRTLALPAGVDAGHLADLDGDEAADLVTIEGGRLVVRWAPSLEERTEIAAPALARSVTAVRARAQASPLVAVLSDDGVVMFELVEGRRLRQREVTIPAPTGHLLLAVDLSLDGLDDLVIAGAGEVHVLEAISEGGPP